MLWSCTEQYWFRFPWIVRVICLAHLCLIARGILTRMNLKKKKKLYDKHRANMTKHKLKHISMYRPCTSMYNEWCVCVRHRIFNFMSYCCVCCLFTFFHCVCFVLLLDFCVRSLKVKCDGSFLELCLLQFIIIIIFCDDPFLLRHNTQPKEKKKKKTFRQTIEILV